MDSHWSCEMLFDTNHISVLLAPAQTTGSSDSKYRTDSLLHKMHYGV